MDASWMQVLRKAIKKNDSAMMHRHLWLSFLLFWQNALADDYASELDYYQKLPSVLSASRMSQPLSEAPNAMTVIDRQMIDASGFRNIADLFKLVPGMYVSYYKGSQPIVSYHGATDQYSRRMQVLIDGRSVYLPPMNTVDWADLPITIDDIERIEVIRGPAAASYGANSTQGVINIITMDAMNGKSASYVHGNKGINDASVRFGHRGDAYDYRMSIAYTADNGYDNLTSNPNGITGVSLLNNSYDSNQARMMNYRGSYHPDAANSYDLQFGFNHDIQGVGFSDKNPAPYQPMSTNGDPIHNLISRSGFLQGEWRHLLEDGSEFDLRYSHTQENQSEAFPVFLGGVYFPGPVFQALQTGRDQFEIQHTLSFQSDRLNYGANIHMDKIDGQSIMPPLSLAYTPSFTTRDYQAYAENEWRISQRLLLNSGGMYEKDWMGRERLSPRVALNYHLTPDNTFRAGISVAYRTPSIVETNLPAVQPGALFVPSAIPNAPGLMPEKMISREIGYIGQFATWDSTVDLRLFRDSLGDGIFYDKTAGSMANGFSAGYRGFEATLKTRPNEDIDLVVNFAHMDASSNGPGLLAAGYTVFKVASPMAVSGTNDILTASIPKNSASFLYSQRLSHQISLSWSYYFQSAMQPLDRNYIDFQPTQHRIDVRIAKYFHFRGGTSANVAFIVQNLLQRDAYTEYIASNLFNRRAFVKATLNW
ncbi:MAG: TonB-dependent receptor [Burkholderiales bacterium]|nr:TonB-dependent receptor [Burkholderiales bacterium]